VYSNIELFRGKHSIVISLCYCLLAVTSILKIQKKLGQEAVLFTEEEILRDTCGILHLWVIFEVLVAVSVKRGVLVATPCRLIEIYHPFFFYHKFRSGRFLLYGGNRASCFLQNICKFLPNFISRKMKFLRTEDLFNRCSSPCALFTFNGWMRLWSH